MAETRWQDELAPVVRQQQIVVGALIAGAVCWLAMVLFLDMGAGNQPETPVMTYVAIMFVVMALLARLIVPGAIVAVGRRRIARGKPLRQQVSARGMIPPHFLDRTGDAGRLALLSNTRTIVSAAILEGTTFFLLVAYMVERSQLSLILAIVLICGLFTHVPTRSRLVHWIEDELVLLEHERQMGH